MNRVYNTTPEEPYYPMTVSGVGGGCPSRWIYSSYGNFLSVYNISSRVELIFNLNSADDIQRKLRTLYDIRDKGGCNPDDVSELEERIRTLSNIELGGNDDKSLSGVEEIEESADKGKVVTVYKDGKPVKVTKRGKFKISTDAQRNAAENARKYAHTEEANTKRRKSINARSNGKILGEV